MQLLVRDINGDEDREPACFSDRMRRLEGPAAFQPTLMITEYAMPEANA